MRFKAFVISILVSFFSATSLAQDFDLSNIHSSIVGPNSEPVIYNAINMNSFDLISTNLQFTEKNNTQKVVVSPFKFLNNSQGTLLRNSRINITQKNGISTFGVGMGLDNSSPFSNRGDRLFEEADIPSKRTKRDDESESEFQKYEVEYYKELNESVTSFYESLLKNSFQLTLGFNISMFSVIGGDKIDQNNDGLIDNQNNVESYNYSLSGTFTVNAKTGFGLSIHHVDRLSEPTQGQERVPYWGGSFNFAQRLFLFDNNYETSENYRKTGFVPSLVFGMTIEYQEATDNETFAKDGITKKTVYTPFFDIKINPKNQFRIGVPIQRFKGINDEISFGPFVQWGFSLANKS